MPAERISTLRRKRGSVKAGSLETKYSDPKTNILVNDFINLESRYTQACVTLNETFVGYQSELVEIVSDDKIDTYYSEREQFFETFYNELARSKSLLLKLN